MKRTCLFASLVLAGIAATTGFAQDAENVEIRAQDLGSGIYALYGVGGNLAVSIGADGTYLIDDQFAPLNDKINAAIRDLGGDQPQYVINTHWHHDHTGGNEEFSTDGSMIMAHDNVRARMMVEQVSEFLGRTTPASPDAALPKLTYSDRASLYVNGEHVHVKHVAHAHTDGDSIIFFEGANVIHMGDTFFNGLYPFIDVESGGNVRGILRAVDMVLEHADSDTQIIPGHGPVTDKAGLQAYRDMVQTITDNIQQLMDQGKSLEEIVAAKPGAKWDEEFGKQFIRPHQLVETIFKSLQQQK